MTNRPEKIKMGRPTGVGHNYSLHINYFVNNVLGRHEPETGVRERSSLSYIIRSKLLSTFYWLQKQLPGKQTKLKQLGWVSLWATASHWLRHHVSMDIRDVSITRSVCTWYRVGPETDMNRLCAHQRFIRIPQHLNSVPSPSFKPPKIVGSDCNWHD